LCDENTTSIDTQQKVWQHTTPILPQGLSRPLGAGVKLALPTLMPIKVGPGALVTTDAPMKQYILHVDDQHVAGGTPSFIMDRLDKDTNHLIIREDFVAFVQEKIDEMQRANSFSREIE
jgi:hypothetical protein